MQQASSGEITLIDQDGELRPISELGTGASTIEQLEPLSEIIRYINEHFGTDFTDADKIEHFAQDMEARLTNQDGLVRALDPEINPSAETRKLAFDRFFGDTLEDMIDANFEIYKKIVNVLFSASFSVRLSLTESNRLVHDAQHRRARVMRYGF